ncbi:hypothetical protein CLF_112076 [Clonorchis sinensis]|uniref:Uncharacterized protein n=1 Tax=Clonorchis sinensis TaxID=79923 RepID=G7YM85_CLOSI|nr:hypothetical protein CLF_112076 [Clonorchis sinensis]
MGDRIIRKWTPASDSDNPFYLSMYKTTQQYLADEMNERSFTRYSLSRNTGITKMAQFVICREVYGTFHKAVIFVRLYDICFTSHGQTCRLVGDIAIERILDAAVADTSPKMIVELRHLQVFDSRCLRTVANAGWCRQIRETVGTCSGFKAHYSQEYELLISSNENENGLHPFFRFASGQECKRVETLVRAVHRFKVYMETKTLMKASPQRMFEFDRVKVRVNSGVSHTVKFIIFGNIITIVIFDNNSR